MVDGLKPGQRKAFGEKKSKNPPNPLGKRARTSSHLGAKPGFLRGEKIQPEGVSDEDDLEHGDDAMHMASVVFGPNFQLPTVPVLGVVDPSSKPLNQKEITERSEI